MNGMLWEFHQEAEIHAARSMAADASSKARGVKETIRFLELRVDKLSLVCHALWTLLQERTGLTEQELSNRVQELDLRDGRLDGKIAKTVSKCRQCGRAIARRHDRCLYCGSRKLKKSEFDGV